MPDLSGLAHKFRNLFLKVIGRIFFPHGYLRWQHTMPSHRLFGTPPASSIFSDCREITFYYNNNQCGDTIILKPISTYKSCDSIIVDYDQGNATFNENTQEVHFYVKYKGGVDLSLNSELKFNNGFAKSRSGTITTSGHQFLVPYSQIQNTIDKNNPKIYADIIIKYPNNEECVKEVEFYLR